MRTGERLSGAGLPIIAVPTFEAFAVQISEYLEVGSEFIIANKVNSEEIYYAKFQVNANKIIFVDSLQVKKKGDFEAKKGTFCFGNAFSDNKNVYFIKRNIFSPDAVHIAKWSKMFGRGLATYDYDYLEPDYQKNFIIKAKNNA